MCGAFRKNDDLYAILDVWGVDQANLTNHAVFLIGCRKDYGPGVVKNR
jgi:hypothetical protein